MGAKSTELPLLGGMEECKCGCACCGSRPEDPEKELERLSRFKVDVERRIAELETERED